MKKLFSALHARHDASCDAYIGVLCKLRLCYYSTEENRDKPAMACNGKCYLQK